MKIAVSYYSKGGSTKKLADAIAKEAGVTAKSVEDGLREPVDLLFLGGAPYAGSALDGHLARFIEGLTSADVKSIAVFSASNWKMSIRPQVKKHLRDSAIHVIDKGFASRGAMGVINKSRPNEKDCAAAAAYAKHIIETQQEVLK